MSEKKQQVIRVSDFDKNKENPFVNEALDNINNHLVKKYKNNSSHGEKAVLHAVNDEGEVLGHTTFVRQIEVDDQEFTKLYLSNFTAFWNLRQQAIRVFGYIMTQLQPNKDTFNFFIDDCMEHTGYKSEKSVYIGLASLLDNSIIARGRVESIYFINPMVAFNGSRVTFAKTYVKKKQKKNVIPENQTTMFPEPKE